MLVANINHPGTYNFLLSDPTWQKVIQWAKKQSTQSKVGRYDIQGDEIFGIVDSLETIPKSQGIFESHRRYIDVQLCLSGSEIIAWAPTKTLKVKKPYVSKDDYALHHKPKHSLELLMTPGTFAVFFPEDAHMPKLSSGQNKRTKKIVVKVATKLVK